MDLYQWLINDVGVAIHPSVRIIDAGGASAGSNGADKINDNDNNDDVGCDPLTPYTLAPYTRTLPSYVSVPICCTIEQLSSLLLTSSSSLSSSLPSSLKSSTPTPAAAQDDGSAKSTSTTTTPAGYEMRLDVAAKTMQLATEYVAIITQAVRYDELSSLVSILTWERWLWAASQAYLGGISSTREIQNH